MLGILKRVFSFSDWQTNHPSDPPPGDMLDASFAAQNAKIDEIEANLLAVLRDDGQLQNAIVHRDALSPETVAFLKAEIAGIAEKARAEAVMASETAFGSRSLAEISAKTAENAASTAQIVSLEAKTVLEDALLQVQGMLAGHKSAISQLEVVESQLMSSPGVSTPFVGGGPGEVEAWASTSRAWAEYMPDTIPASVLDMMAITGDHWSSRWWANQAANAFGVLTSLYYGALPSPPLTNSAGGPIEVGAIYYNTTTQQAYVWTGSSWEAFYGVQRAGITTLWYTASASQTLFTLTNPDTYGHTYSLSASAPEGVDVHVNGLKKSPSQFTVNYGASTVTLGTASTAGDVVAIDIMMPNSALGAGSVQNWQLKPLIGVNGVLTTFALSTLDVSGPTVNVLKNEELLVILDGITQQPTTSYTATGASITFLTAPEADSKIFIIWQKSQPVSGAVSEAPIDGATYGRKNAAWIALGYLTEAPNDGLQYVRKSLAWAELANTSNGSVLNYMFNASTAAPPALGTIRLNNATQTAATVLWLNYTTNDSIAINLKTYFLARVKIGDTIYMQDKDVPTKWQLYQVSAAWTDNSTYAALPVVWLAGGSALTAARIIVSRQGATVNSPVGEAPVDSKLYGRESGNWVQTAKVIVSSTAPGSPDVGDVWIDTT